jgi:uncharacterized RDD family membrane protein YckC
LAHGLDSLRPVASTSSPFHRCRRDWLARAISNRSDLIGIVECARFFQERGLPENTVAPAYGRFSRRLQAVLLDSIIFLLLMAVALSVATAMQSDNVGRILGFTFIAILMLYEPLLVPLTGGTIGHYLCNLRVVDDRTRGNIGFLKAVARGLIKSLLGIYSFITMGTTLRHQALHDVLTHSTVQIRSLDHAKTYHYIGERTLSAAPSRTRRVTIIILYLIAFYLLVGAATAFSLSTGCLTKRACSSADSLWAFVIAAVWMSLSAYCIIYGWRGKLYGCRVRPRLGTDQP